MLSNYKLFFVEMNKSFEHFPHKLKANGAESPIYFS